MTPLSGIAQALLGAEIDGIGRLHGGDLSEVSRIHLSDGRSLVAKTGPTARTEAAMLQAIRRTGTPAPDVVAVTDDFLVLKDLGHDEGPGRAWADLGRVLRNLHNTMGEAYGCSEDHWFGKVNIPNYPAPNWPEFWAERRLIPSCPEIPPSLARRVEAFAARLGDRLPQQPPPSLLHGDLWTGNVMARGSEITGLIDPSCYFGHAEVDLAMLTLFATPGTAFWGAYGPLDPGFDARRPVYQLWPALVHLRLFGAGYQGLVERCLQSVG